jgi:hypothetical protein
MRIPDHIDRNDHEAIAAWIESDEFDPSPDDFQDATPLRRIVAADEALEQARAHLDSEVQSAHDAGLSWTAIGAVLGISRQAARQRFGTAAHT